MAVLYLDGFESYGNTANSVTTANTVGNKWVAVAETSMKVQTGRIAGYAISMETSTTRIIKPHHDQRNNGRWVWRPSQHRQWGGVFTYLVANR